jgi:AcrR family transcriptional regulator
MENSILNKEEIIRAEVIQEARVLFQQYGLWKTTMEDIARAMKKGKSTLYYYYKSKDEIFEAVVNKEIQDVFNEIRSAVQNCSSAEEKLKIYFRTAANSVKDKVLLYKIMKGTLGENLKIIVNLKCTFDSGEVQFIREILQFGLDENEFTDTIAGEIDLLAYSVVSALRSITIDLIVEDKFPDWDKRIGVLSEVFIRGLKK